MEKALERPANERAYLLIPIGHPAEDAEVPDLERKPLADVMADYPLNPQIMNVQALDNQKA